MGGPDARILMVTLQWVHLLGPLLDVVCLLGAAQLLEQLVWYTIRSPVLQTINREAQLGPFLVRELLR